MKNFRFKSLCLMGFGATLLLIWMFKMKDVSGGNEQKPAASPTVFHTRKIIETHSALNSKNPGENAALAQMSPNERRVLSKKFNEKFKPAVEKWCNAYEGRVPFHPEDVTLDKFHSRLGNGPGFSLYTFMIGDTTFTIADTKENARIFYLMTGGAAKTLNSMPKDGAIPVLKLPVTRQQVIKMALADVGIQYQPQQVEIKPTGVACALNGGAFVEIGRRTINGMELLTGTNLSMVFDPDGKLISYQH